MIVNWSQILNTYFFHNKNTICDERKSRFLYDKISLLSSLSQLEIDRSKKFFDKIDIPKVLREMPKLRYDNGDEVNDTGDTLVAKK